MLRLESDSGSKGSNGPVRRGPPRARIRPVGSVDRKHYGVLEGVPRPGLEPENSGGPRKLGLVLAVGPFEK